MSKIIVNALCIGLGVAGVLGVAGCNRQADANIAANAAAPPTGEAGTAAVAGDGQYAQVIKVAPVMQNVSTPQQVCHDETIERKVPPKDQHQIAGTVIGAVAGGLLGHTIGGGRGNTVATVAGAVGGGYAGKKIEENRQDHNVQLETVRRCSTVANTTSTIAGYDVTYVYNGVTRTTRMDHDPGDRLKMVQSVSVVANAQ